MAEATSSQHVEPVLSHIPHRICDYTWLLCKSVTHAIENMSTFGSTDSNAPPRSLYCLAQEGLDETPWNGSTCLPSTESVLLHLDGTIVTEKVIGQGATGIIIEQGQFALKLPRISNLSRLMESLSKLGP